MNEPLITMTHVCRSWRNALLSTPSLWTQIDFSTYESKQAEGFLNRSGEQLLDIYQAFISEEDTEPFLSTTLPNTHRLQRLEIASYLPDLESVLKRFTRPAPELECLEITNAIDITDRDMGFHSTIFEGRFPKLLSLSLHWLHMNLPSFSFPSLKRFNFMTGTNIPVERLTSFLERHPLLEYIQISVPCVVVGLPAPPRKRVQLDALKELRFNELACSSGLLNHLSLPKCTEVVLEGLFTGAEFDDNGCPAARVHPSSIDHLPVTRGITKAVAMPISCILSGPGGNLRFWCFRGTRENFDAEFFTSFSPISVSEIRELWVGHRDRSSTSPRPWEQTPAGVRGAFGVLTKVEDLTIVNCDTMPFFSTLGATVDGGVLLPRLRKLTIYVGRGDLDVSALIQCAEARKEHFQPIGEVVVVFEDEPEGDFVEGAQLLRAFVGGLIYRVGQAPRTTWDGGEY